MRNTTQTGAKPISHGNKPTPLNDWVLSPWFRSPSKFAAKVDAWVRGRRWLSVGWTVAVVAGVILMAYPYMHGVFPLDLRVYLAGGAAVAHNHQLYSQAVEINGYPFTYPPFPAAVFALLSSAGPFVSKLITIATFYVSLFIVISKSSPGLIRRAPSSWRSAVVLGTVLLVQPTWATLDDGQVNMLLAMLIIVDLQRDRTMPGRGLLLGVAIAVKLTPAAFLIYLIAGRQFIAARNAVLSFMLLSGISWFFLPADSRQYWFHAIRDSSRVGQVSRFSNQSLLGMITRETSHRTVQHVVWMIVEVGVAMLFTWVAVRLTAQGQTILALAIVGCMSCLLSPISWTHHWVWFVPALCSLVGSPQWRLRGTRCFAASASLTFIIGCNRLGPVYTVPGLHFLLGSAYVIMSIVGVVFLGVLLRRQGKSFEVGVDNRYSVSVTVGRH